jgi:CRP-like cAMP-binding protein
MKKFQSSIRNKLLKKLEEHEFALLQPHLEEVHLALKCKIETRGQPVEHVYFFQDGVASIIAVTQDNTKSVEVGVIGYEGMSGLAVVLGSGMASHETIIQIESNALRIPSDKLREIIAINPAIHTLFLKFSQVFAVQSSSTIVANCHFTITERLARWLLMCHDRARHDEFTITHQFLSIMLGVRRPSVTTALHMLEGAQIIRSSRSRIRIINRQGLEKEAGQSYGAPEQEYSKLLGPEQGG